MIDSDEITIRRYPPALDHESRVIGVLAVHVPTGLAVVEDHADTYAANRDAALQRLDELVEVVRVVDQSREVLAPGGSRA